MYDTFQKHGNLQIITIPLNKYLQMNNLWRDEDQVWVHQGLVRSQLHLESQSSSTHFCCVVTSGLYEGTCWCKKKSYNKLLIDNFKWCSNYEEYRTHKQRYSTCVWWYLVLSYIIQMVSFVSNKHSLWKKIHSIM